jgi:AcrR family transcriptional regulator
MIQEERSQRSRSQILEAALDLFSHRGYGATSVRDIARAANASTGNVYHHFKDKEAIFNELLNQYWAAIDSADFPFNRALVSAPFPDNIEAIGFAARDTIEQWRRHVALIYVDVVEFEGQHIRRYYREMADRFTRFLESNRDRIRLDLLRPGVSPTTAVMLVTRFFLHYFAVEYVFGVPNHFGKDTDEVLHETVDVLARGMLRADGKTA